MDQITDTTSFALLAGEGGFAPIAEQLRTNVRATIKAVFDEELANFLGRLRTDRGTGPAKGYRHGHRERQLTGTFGTETVRVPRARIEDETGKVTEWRSKALPRYQRLTKTAEALIAAVSLAGTNSRRVKRALFGLFEGAVSKGVRLGTEARIPPAQSAQWTNPSPKATKVSMAPPSRLSPRRFGATR